ncbi:hypothetical protein WJX81_007013 [Elliptochloris bilobata]|uniref:S1 motif domain-containing protein n=1 Tax=Elliptochloris bilobata TaxID=381761 RepID=A0AAW1R3B1_9CHLO
MDFTNAEDLYARFNQLLDQGVADFQQGDKVTGVIATVDQRGAYVEIGGKMPAYCPADELSLCKLSRVDKVIAPDSVREFVIMRVDNRNGEVQLSIKRLEQALMWQRLRQLRDHKVYYPARVVSANRSGALAEVHGQTGFIPGSHIPNDIDMEALPGKDIMCVFLEVDEEGQRLVLSARRRVNKSAKAFKVGDVVLGSVQAVQAYGAFVELGSDITGLLHVSQISSERITNVDKVLSVGDKLKVMILTYDKERGRISLSTKKLEPSPGDMLRNPALVFEKADEMAASFKERFAEAEAASRDLTGAGFPPAEE